MTLQDLATTYIENKFSYVNKFTDDDMVEIKTEEQYNRIKTKYNETIEQLKAVDLQPSEKRGDFKQVDSLYASKFAQQALDINQNIADNISSIIAEANEKIFELNKPIEENWKKLLKEHDNLVQLQNKLNKYRQVINFYYNLTKKDIIPITDLNITDIANKTDKIDSIVSSIKIIDKVLAVDDFIFSVVGISVLFLMMTPLSLLVIIAAVIGAITGVVLVFFSLYNNNDLVSFSLQAIDDLDESKYHKLYDFNDEIFNEFQVRLNEQEERANSKELLELTAKGNGDGSEEYREEFIRLLEPANKMLQDQFDIGATIASNITEYENNYSSNHKYLGEKYSLSPVFDYNLVINKGELFEETLNIKNKVISINYKDYKDRDAILKLLIFSMYSNIILTNLKTIIYDRKYFGEFASTMGYLDGNDHAGNQVDLTVYDKDLNQVLDIIKDHIRITQKKRKGISIDEYNENSTKDINLCTQYLLCILDLDKGKDAGDDNAEIKNKELLNIIDSMYENGCILVVCSQGKFKCNKEMIEIGE